MKRSSSRRHFIQQMSGTALALAATNSGLAFAGQWQNKVDGYSKKISPNDKIRFATIGMGIMGYNDTNTALKVPGTELVAVADLYTGRLARAKEKYGNNIQVTQNYQDIISRKDIDAVVIATADLWHARISIDALKAGKAVYCEKPMVHEIREGLEVIDAWKKSNKTMQIGSQRVSSIGRYQSPRSNKKRSDRTVGHGSCKFRQTKRPGCLGIYHAFRCISDHG